MFGLILDSLGSTELLFILVIALIFFGPRKLPQLARSMGKSMAEFRKASEDFKRTWEREVALESARLEAGENSILETDQHVDKQPQLIDETKPEPTSPDYVVARQNQAPTIPGTPTLGENKTATTATGPSRKHDWL